MSKEVLRTLRVHLFCLLLGEVRILTGHGIALVILKTWPLLISQVLDLTMTSLLLVALDASLSLIRIKLLSRGLFGVRGSECAAIIFELQLLPKLRSTKDKYSN